MKLATLFLAVVGLATASPSLLDFVDTTPQVALTNDLKVPGQNPLYFCEEPAGDLLTIDDVELSPNPPEAGKSLSITATGTLAEDIEEGAKVRLQVKYGLITLIKQEASLCDYVKEIDLECPLKKGDLKLSKDVELPKQIPPGKYTVLADVYTKDNSKITCLTAVVVFSR